jgi:hypothetical protein
MAASLERREDAVRRSLPQPAAREYLVRMNPVTLVVLALALLAAFFYVLFLVVRAAVRAALVEDRSAKVSAPGGHG